jgi:HEAT repeat protein
MKIIGDPGYLFRTWWLKRLARKLQSRRKVSRANAVRSLGCIQDERVVPHLIRALHDPDPLVRYDAVFALGVREGYLPIDELGKIMLSDPAPSVRYAVAIVFSWIPNASAIEPILLKAHSTEIDPFCRLWIGVGLLNLGNQHGLDHLFSDIRAVDSQGQTDWDDAPAITGALAALGQPALESLLFALKDPCAVVRWIAILALGESGDIVAAQHLLEGLDIEEDASNRSEIAWILGDMGFRQALPKLLSLLEQSDHDVCFASIRALGKIGDATALSALRHFTGVRPITVEDRKLLKAAQRAIEAIEASQVT